MVCLSVLERLISLISLEAQIINYAPAARKYLKAFNSSHKKKNKFQGHHENIESVTSILLKVEFLELYIAREF